MNSYNFALMKYLPLIALATILLIACNHSLDEREITRLTKANDSLVSSRDLLKHQIKVKSDSIFSDFIYGSHRDIKPYHDLNVAVAWRSDSIFRQIQNLKSYLIIEVLSKGDNTNQLKGRINPDSLLRHLDYSNESNSDIPNQILLNNDGDGTTGEAIKLKRELNKYRSDIIHFLDFSRHFNNIENCEKDTAQMKIGLLTLKQYIAKDGQTEAWEIYTFKDKSMVADILALSELQNNIRKTQLEFVNYSYRISNIKYLADKDSEKIFLATHHQ